MWLKFCSLLCCAVVLVGGYKRPPPKPSGTTTYEFDQIADAVKLTLSCLERNTDLGANATYQVAAALGELYYIEHTVPDLDETRQAVIQGIISRFDAFLQRGLINFKDYIDAQLLWYPQYWGLVGEFYFQNGRISSRPYLRRTLSEIYERSASTEEGIQCYNDLVSQNKGSPVRRECTSPCEDKASDTDFETGLVPEDRWNYIFTEQLLNCTTNTPEETFAKVEYVCKYAKLEADAMYRQRMEDQFGDIYYYFLIKLQFCGSMGFAEFCNREFITLLMSTIDCNGCVGIPKMTDEAKQVLTAMTSSILSSVLRYTLEQEYPVPSVDPPIYIPNRLIG